MISSELLVDDGDNLARNFLECSNDTYLCMHLKKFQNLLPITQNVCLAQDDRIQKEVKQKQCFLG